VDWLSSVTLHPFAVRANVFVERLYDVAYAVLHLVPAFEVIGGVHSANVDFKPRLFFPTTIDRIRGFGD
jgi:hypothetical protein